MGKLINDFAHGEIEFDKTDIDLDNENIVLTNNDQQYKFNFDDLLDISFKFGENLLSGEIKNNKIFELKSEKDFIGTINNIANDYSNNFINICEKQSQKKELQNFLDDIFSGNFCKGIDSDLSIGSFILFKPEEAWFSILSIFFSLISSFFIAAYEEENNEISFKDNAFKMLSNFFIKLTKNTANLIRYISYNSFDEEGRFINKIWKDIIDINENKIKNISEIIPKKIELSLDCLIHGYFPYYFKEKDNTKYNPCLKWKVSSEDCKQIGSFIIEAIENNLEVKWRVLNISPKTTEIYVKSQNIGEVSIPFKGFSKYSNSISFIIYGIRQDKIEEKDWLNISKIKEDIRFYGILKNEF